jgi:branched-chain amino acid transport system permease protein
MSAGETIAHAGDGVAAAKAGAQAHARRALHAVLVLAALGLPWLLDDYQTFQCTLVLSYALAILGLNVLTGYNGQISLGHGAFFAIGAYTVAILMARFGIPYWAALPVAGAAGLVFGLLFGLPALRLRGHYLALATFGLALAVPQLLKHKSLQGWTGGVGGIVLVKPDAPWGLPLSQDQWLYYFALAVAALGFWLAANLLRGRIGDAMVAIRDHAVAASAMGVDVAYHKTMAFGISAMYTGVAGGLAAVSVQYVAPDSFGIFLSIALLVGVVVGGLGTLGGALFGALFVQFVPNLAESYSKAAPAAVYGALLIAVILLMPGGVVGAMRGLAAKLRR